MEKKHNSVDNIIDLKEFLFKIINNWFYFLLSITFFIMIAVGYTRYSKEYYKSSLKILVKNDNESNSAAEVLYKSLDNTRKTSSIKDEMQLFTAYPIIMQTVKDLRFDISYFLIGNVKTSETHLAPVKMITDLTVTQENPNLSFEIDVLDNQRFNMINEKFDIDKEFRFGAEIEIDDYKFVVKINEDFIISETPITIIKFNPLKKIVKNYQSRLEISPVEKESNVLQLSVLEEDQKKGVLFLNQLVENYIKNEIENKKESSLNTVYFIENEISIIEDSLSLIEEKLEDYKNSHQIPDLDLKTQNIYNKISDLESELATYKYQDKYYSYLEDYINKGNSLEKIIAPSTYGISNSSLSELIKQMVNLQLEKNVLIEGGQINNPSVEDFDLQLKQLSLNIKEVIVNSKKSNNIIIMDLNSRINIEEASLSTLPLEQRELKSIERIQESSEELYTFLLQKKAEAEIKASSIVSNIEIIDKSYYSSKDPVLPNSSKVYSICILLGFLFPAIILLLLDLINEKIRSRIDLEKLTDIDLIGVIGRNHSGHTLLTKLNPKSSIAEGFRALRSNLNYQDKKEKNKVYLVTSSLSGEGKTFLASNLAVVYANAGKRTLILGADLRRPRLFEDFSANNSKGLSSVLLGDDSISDVIINTDIDNLDVIVSGPLPSNPSDVFIGDKFEKFMNNLKKSYDKIIIDSAPIGLVADAYMIMKYADINLYVVRQGFTDKNVLRFVNDLYEKERVENLFLVLNDVSSGSGVYGYGKYGYGYGYGYGGYGGYGYSAYINDSDYFEENEE